MGNLQVAYNTCIEACNRTNPPALYSMDSSMGLNGLARRAGGTFLSDPYLGSMGATQQNPIQYFDCSGFMSYCLWKAGYSERNVAFTTFYEADYLKQMGWEIFPYYKGIPLRAGDIVWYNTVNQYGKPVGHTEMIYNATTRQSMGAAGRGTEWGIPPTKSAVNQVRILDTNTDSVYNWQYLARDIHAGVPTDGLKWIYKDEYLTEDESWNNATLAGACLASEGVGMIAICAILGNMMAESGVEPWLGERGGGGGYGLVQWTPKSDLIEAVRDYNLGDYTLGDTQCKVIPYECGKTGDNRQWYSDTATAYPIHPIVPFTDFITWSTRDDYTPSQMAEAFMCWYERPAVATAHLDRRKEWAEKFYARFKDGMFNGIGAFNFGVSTTYDYIYLMDYVRRKNTLKIQ